MQDWKMAGICPDLVIVNVQQVCLAIPDATTLLPVRSRVQFKLYTLMHAIHNKRSPSYLSDAVQTVATATRCGLQSSATTEYGLRAHFYVQR